MSSLQAEVGAVLDRIPADFGGGCSVSKAYLLAWLIRRYDLKTTVDIGVYRGRSLFPQAIAHKQSTGGVVFGVDPWLASEAREHDNPEKKRAIDRFVDRTDFESICQDVAALNRDLRCEDHCILVRKTSSQAATLFKEKNTMFDLVHIDGNHDTEKVADDLAHYLPRLNKGGFLIMDDISWASVRPAYNEMCAKMSLVFERVDKTNDYAVFWNEGSRLGTLSRRLVLRYIGRGTP